MSAKYEETKHCVSYLHDLVRKETDVSIFFSGTGIGEKKEGKRMQYLVTMALSRARAS